MVIFLGDKEYVAGWCFEGFTSAEKLTSLLIEVLKFIGIETGEFIIEETEDVVRVSLPTIVGTSYRFRQRDRVEERVRVLLVSCTKFSAYEVGLLLKDKLDMLMVGRGYFTY